MPKLLLDQNDGRMDGVGTKSYYNGQRIALLDLTDSVNRIGWIDDKTSLDTFNRLANIHLNYIEDRILDASKR